MRESTPTTGAPVLVQSQGRLLREGAGAGPDHGAPGHVPDPDLGDLGGDLDLEDLAPGWVGLPLWRRLNSFWSPTSSSSVRNTVWTFSPPPASSAD